MVRTVPQLVSLVAVVRENNVSSEKVALAQAAVVEDGKRTVLLGTGEGAPKSCKKRVSRQPRRDLILPELQRRTYPIIFHRPCLIFSASSGKWRSNLRSPELMVTSAVNVG